MSSRKIHSSAMGRRRSAMGEYVPAPGEVPLSSNALPTPSAFEYHPKTDLTLPSSPSFSLRSRPYPLKELPSPSPSDYTIRESTEWRSNFTLTRKGKTWPYSAREDAHFTCSPGAGYYRRASGDTGSGIKRSLSARHRDGVHAGYPNPLIQPVDTHGFETPGPGLWRNSERGTEKTFGMALKSAKLEAESPGPAMYTLPSPTSPAPLFGQLLHSNTDQHYPAPNEYTINSTIGTGVSRTFGIKQDFTQGANSPAPNAYNSNWCPSGASHTLSYRPFPVSEEQRPGAAEYHVTDSDLPSSPTYSCRVKGRPVFPDILHYPQYSTVHAPGPGNYEYDHSFADNSSPKPSIGLPLPKKPNTNPGPNHYHVGHHICSDNPTPPSFSMGKQLPTPAVKDTLPGPADYALRPHSAVSLSITPRRMKEKGSETPGANCYHVQRGQTRQGQFNGPTASMKGRRSTMCYSGFPSSHLARLASLST